MNVYFTADYKQFKEGDTLDRPEFALEEFLTAGVVAEGVVEVEEEPKPKPKKSPAKKAAKK